MKEHLSKILNLCMIFIFLSVSALTAQVDAKDSDMEELKSMIKQMQKTIDKQNQRIEELEKTKAAPAKVAAAPG